MGFTQLEFVLLFAVLIPLVWSCPGRTTRHGLLLTASYYFYAYWDWRFCSLLLLSTIVDYVAARRIAAGDSPRVRLAWLLASLATNLGVLGFFKYFNFFVDSARPLVESLGWSASTLEIILPVGISFYTFQTLSYTIDVYRGVLRPVERPLEFALYVAFFPQLVAGPIVRAREFLPQLAQVPAWSSRRFYGGLQLMLRGAVKKVLIADRLAEATDVVFAGPDLYSGLTLWIGVIAYTGQIYYDFSGYSDLATGAAKTLGYRFPLNFRHPYLATSPSEFWRRWHITLSRWLRDYLYIPLGGSRIGPVNTYRNLLVTMSLGGLWHGAAWTFVLWGVWHGLALAVPRFVAARLAWRMPSPLAWLATMALVVVGWVLFRSQSLGEASVILRGMVTWQAGIVWLPPLPLVAIGCMIAEHLAWRTRLRIAMRLPFTAWYSPVVTSMLIWALVLYAPRGFRPFVYFQF